MGIDFNPTFFSHPMVEDNLTLSSPDEEVRTYWVNHGKACLKIAEYFAEETGIPCVINIWIPDGYKDIPVDRLTPRMRFKNSLDEILDTPYDKEKVYATAKKMESLDLLSGVCTGFMVQVKQWTKLLVLLKL